MRLFKWRQNNNELLQLKKNNKQKIENSTFIFMALQLALLILFSQLLSFVSVCGSRLFHDLLKSKETMGLNGPSFPWVHRQMGLPMETLPNQEVFENVSDYFYLFIFVYRVINNKFSSLGQYSSNVLRKYS